MMSEFAEIAAKLRTRLAELTARAEIIEDDLRQPLDADFSEQAIDLADDEMLEGVDDVLRAEAQQIRYALTRIKNGTYGVCSNCGKDIPAARLEVQPIAARCVACA
jgi:RNA polymerase-binding transcription factor DksA